MLLERSGSEKQFFYFLQLSLVCVVHTTQLFHRNSFSVFVFSSTLPKFFSNHLMTSSCRHHDVITPHFFSRLFSLRLFFVLVLLFFLVVFSFIFLASCALFLHVGGFWEGPLRVEYCCYLCCLLVTCVFCCSVCQLFSCWAHFLSSHSGWDLL